MRHSAFVALLLFASGAAIAGSICPGATSGTTFTHPPDPTGTGCNFVIAINANGTTTITNPDIVGFSGGDAIVGIVNNGAVPLRTLTLLGQGIFAFDGNGICTFTFSGSGYCAAGHSTDPFDYEGPTSSFSNFSSLNSGTVSFSPAVPAGGGSTYLSIEGVPSRVESLATNVTPNIPPNPPPTTPAPSTLLSLGLGLALLAGWAYRAQIRERLTLGR
ncbi:MAG TPA: hypothetical protein VH640_17405 [Bryobacteraceae bacterium]|jgi:hypothetical protein